MTEDSELRRLMIAIASADAPAAAPPITRAAASRA
jgi:hypothetical protein